MLMMRPTGACRVPVALLGRATRRCRLVHALCASGFDAWIAVNPLPGATGSPALPGATGSPSGSGFRTRHYPARRFSWAETPEVAAAFLNSYVSCSWSLDGSGLLAAHSSSASGAPVARLALPRVLAGSDSCGMLWAGSSLDAYPPSMREDAAQQQLRQALASLAGLAGSHGSSIASSSTPLTIGSQLLVLLSADSAALALYSEGELQQHNVHTGYTVRRQQGKAQATYERQGGGEPAVMRCGGRRGRCSQLPSAAATLAAERLLPATLQLSMPSAATCRRRAQHWRLDPRPGDAAAVPGRRGHPGGLGARHRRVQPALPQRHR